MSNRLNGQEDWYAPLKAGGQEKVKASTKKGKGAAWKITGLICLILLLIIGSSLAFGRNAEDAGSPRADESLPENWKDFFDNYYTTTSTEKTESNIQRTEYTGPFQIELQKAEGEELSLQELYGNCAQTIVAISAYKDGARSYAWGTGVILSEDGIIVTNAHLVEDCDSAEVTLSDDSSYEARLVGLDGISDLAVLKINATGLQAAEMGDSGELTVGDSVAAIGNPLGASFRLTLTNGIVSAIERGINYKGHSMALIQTNTAINEGSSGGALFNMYGQVVGITNMKMASSYYSVEGMSFAIPSSTVKEIVSMILAEGEVRGRPSLGITVGAIPSRVMEQYGLPEGLYVSAVEENSDAAAKGIMPGDIITAVNAVSVKTTQEMLDIKNGLQVGDQVRLSIWRDGESFELEITLIDTNDLYGKNG